MNLQSIGRRSAYCSAPVCGVVPLRARLEWLSPRRSARDRRRLLGLAPEAYTPSQMSYDLRRLRLKGLIARIAGKHTYILTTFGRKVVYLMPKLQQRIFDVASSALETTSALSSQLARTFHLLDEELDRLVTDAQLAPMKS